MNRRLFLWGLSNGAIVLALAGAFWIGLGIGMTAKHVHWTVTAAGTLIQIGGVVVLMWTALRLRRRSGFQRAELRHPEGVTEGQRKHLARGMRWTTLAQTLVVGILVWICVRAGAEHLIWPAIGAAVSLHFAPLGRIFHVRAYYAIAIAGTIISAVAFAVSRAPYGVASFGLAMTIVMWAASAYVLLNADRIADRACAEVW